ncbi:glycosyl hydrolase family 92 [Colletotrichum lupini]|uniref:Glycosyl hydrolase family 92 n=1 Tax=Colletotrichum lupini TaxID=145971 RepID=A0A9Q8T7W2_9PEZI|nr:glycosyl hydrolase family 92 [Colletotrichum lupini]UQC90889.1 glycosyl hydrolase family 92 [Colletotrichum lupini]
MRFLVPLIAFVVAGCCQSFDPLAFVDPLIGSQRGGNVFAGATLPYGLAKAVADVDGEKTGGYSTDGSNITGFSIVHDSGTGGNPSLGNFPLFPQLCPGDELNNCRFRIGDRATQHEANKTVAEPGYFSVELSSGVKADMTVSEHAALMRFKFPSGGSEHPLVLLDLTDLWASRQNASIKVDTPTGRMFGNGTFLPSFGAGSYVLHYCVDFFGAQVFDTGVWVNNRAGNEPKELFITRGFNLFDLEGGGFVRFKELTNDTVTARVGVSFKSSDQACRNAEKEIPDPLNNFDSLVKTAKDAWREKLSPVSVKAAGATEDLQKSFWSGLYPQAQMINSMLDIYKHEGWLPDCRMSLCKGWTQGGSNADVVIVDSYVKNLTSIDWKVALAAITKDAEDEPLEWSYEGRGGLTSWKTLNYIPYLDFDPVGFGTNSRSITRTLEYSYNDYCLATLAQGLGEGQSHDKYIARSMNWQNLWKEDQRSLINGTDTGFSGFFQPKYMNGTWGFQDPIACSNLAGFCSLTTNPSETFEASIWQYQFIVPHSTSTLIDLMGGDDAFVSRLNYFHASPLADISNEPVFLTVYLYHYAGRPGLSAERIHKYIPSAFNSSRGGLPGNDDSGAMGAFLAFSVMGLFPVAGQNVYLITPPFFEEVSVKNPVTGGNATIKCVGFDAAYKNIYVQSAKLDEEAYTKSWIGHEFFSQGKTLELTLGDKESDWGKSKEARPPSYVAVSKT